MKDLTLFHLYHHAPGPLSKEAVQIQYWLHNNRASYAIVASISASTPQEALLAAQQQARGERTPRGTVVRADALLRPGEPGDVLVAERHAWMVSLNGQPVPITHSLEGDPQVYDANYSVSALAWLPDGQTLLAAESDNQVSLHRREGPTRFALRYTRARSACQVLACAPDGTRVASGGNHGEVQIWHPDPRSTEGYQGSLVICCPRETSTYQRPDICALTWSPDGRQVLAGRKDGQVLCWEASTGDLQVEYPLHERALTALAFAPQRPDLLLTASLDGSVRIWQAREQELVRYQHETMTTAACWSPDGSLVASCARQDETLHLWDARTGRLGMRIPLAQNSTTQLEIHSLAWSPDGRLLAAGCSDSSVQLIDIAQGIPIHSYWISTQAHRQVQALTWSPDGRLLAAGGDGYRAGVFVWDVARDLALETPCPDETPGAEPLPDQQREHTTILV